MDELPLEILLEIFSYLDRYTFWKLSLVNKALHKICNPQLYHLVNQKYFNQLSIYYQINLDKLKQRTQNLNKGGYVLSTDHLFFSQYSHRKQSIEDLIGWYANRTPYNINEMPYNIYEIEHKSTLCDFIIYYAGDFNYSSFYTNPLFYRKEFGESPSYLDYYNLEKSVDKFEMSYYDSDFHLYKSPFAKGLYICPFELMIHYLTSNQVLLDPDSFFEAFGLLYKTKAFNPKVSLLESFGGTYCYQLKRLHAYNFLDILSWYINKHPEIISNISFKNIYRLMSFSESTIKYWEYFNSLISDDIRLLLLQKVKTSSDAIYDGFRYNFGFPNSIKNYKNLLRKYPWFIKIICEYFPEWIFKLVDNRQKVLIKIMIELDQGSIRKLKYKKQNLLEYALGVKKGSSLHDLIRFLKLKFSSREKGLS